MGPESYSMAERLEGIRAELGEHPVKLIAVTKYATPAQMVEAYELGLRDFGENKVQDALEKKSLLPPEVAQGVTWHLIGHLQSNKINKTLRQFSLIHAIDSVELAEQVSLRNVNIDFCQPVLLQINVSGEASKHGFPPSQTLEALQKISALPGLDIQGFMTMAPATKSVPQILDTFCGLRDLRDTIKQQTFLPLRELSMGMTQDYIHAIACGATMIRLGSALFQ